MTQLLSFLAFDVDGLVLVCPYISRVAGNFSSLFLISIDGGSIIAPSIGTGTIRTISTLRSAGDHADQHHQGQESQGQFHDEWWMCGVSFSLIDE